MLLDALLSLSMGLLRLIAGNVITFPSVGGLMIDWWNEMCASEINLPLKYVLIYK